jgi:hypothetical protein
MFASGDAGSMVPNIDYKPLGDSDKSRITPKQLKPTAFCLGESRMQAFQFTILASKMNKRRTQRQKTFKGARIVFNQGNSTMNCLVRDVSNTGAQLQFVNALHVPDVFDLMFAGEKSAMRSCRIIWRKQNRIGVVFKAP